MRRKWSKVEDAFMRENYPNRATAEMAFVLNRSLTATYRRAAQLGLTKSVEFKAALLAKAGSALKEAGKATRLKPGLVPWNKGKPYQPRGRSLVTQFKPGQMPHTWRPVGTRRVTKEGYVEEKVADTGDTGADYVPVHHLVWTAAGNPPVPKGHALVFRDGDNRNFALENLELITRRELMARNSVHNYGPEMSRVVQLRGVISRKLNQHRRKGTP
jgi:hypothetical protein